MAASPCRRRTTITPTRSRPACSESRSFERCAPSTPWHDRTRASTTPLRARVPCTARICTCGHIHGRTVSGGWSDWGLACGSLTIYTHHAMGHKKGVQYRLRRETLHPPWQVSATLTARLAEDQARVGDRLLSRGLLHGVCGLHELYRVPLRCTPPSNPNSTLLISCVLLRAPPIPPAPR